MPLPATVSRPLVIRGNDIPPTETLAAALAVMTPGWVELTVTVHVPTLPVGQVAGAGRSAPEAASNVMLTVSPAAGCQPSTLPSFSITVTTKSWGEPTGLTELP